MAEQFLEEIYREAENLFQLKYLLEQAREERYPVFGARLNELLPRVGKSCERYTQCNAQAGMELWKDIQELRGCAWDFIHMGDLMEGKIIPKYQAYVASLGNVCVDDEEGFCLQSSESGFLTMKMTDSGKYFHSFTDPMWEAYLMAKQLFTPEKTSYSLWGCGLGYLPYQLYLYTGGAAKIRVYEPNEKMVRYGKNYGVLAWIPQDRLEVTVSGDILPFFDSIADETVGYYIHEPACFMIQKEQQAIVGNFLMVERTRRVRMKDLQINYYRNIANITQTVSDFDGNRMKKEMIVVGAGPSLDDTMDYLRKMQGEKSLIAVGTVFSKLVKAGIRPDAVAVLDGYARTSRQIEGLESWDVPLFVEITAHWGFGARYEGEKYLVLSRESCELTEGYAKKTGETYLRCGTTVTAMAIAVALCLGAKDIELAGVDMAYPGNVTHATGTLARRELEIKENPSGLILTESVNGGQVYTDPVFCEYRKEIEEIVRANPSVRFWNLSRVGAKIDGTELKLG